ncbi:S16 family serine protease [Candidatus Nitrospira bockiana]
MEAGLRVFVLITCAVLSVALGLVDAEAKTGRREQLIPILGVTMEKKPVGTVANLIVAFEERDDHGGLSVHFKSGPGRFSKMAQTAIQQAIYRAARAANMATDSWTIVLGVPHPGVTIYGDSLSAMVSVTVLALARGEPIPPDRVITGAVSPDGRIAPVGSVPLKVAAANEAHLRRVVIPEEMDVADADWRTPFLMQVSPVRSISQAYQALTDHPLGP